MKRFLRYLLAAAVPAALLAGPAGLVAESLAADGRNPQEKQLLAVLPAASKSLLPPCFQWLMTSPESPIIDSYPVEFEQVRDKEPYFGLKVNFISLRDLYQTGFPMVKV